MGLWQSNEGMLDDMTSSQDIISIGVLSDQRCYFRAALYYQPLRPWHIVDVGLQIKLDVSSGINYAKFPSDIDLESGDESRLNDAKANQLRIVSDDEVKPDANNVSMKVMNAVSWDDAAELEYIIRACYVSVSAGADALIEACSRGLESCAELLLLAGVPPVATASSQGGRGAVPSKNAFHHACENGHESCARLLISHMGSIDECYLPTPSGLSGFDVLRAHDMAGMARRLEAFAADRLDPKT